MRRTLRTGVEGIVVLMAAFVHTAMAGAQPPAGNGAPTPPAGMQQSFLHDPVLNMDAFVVNYPRGWHLEGRVWQGSRCNSVPAQIFRITSPDGLIMVERMPSFDWSWGSSPMVAQGGGCLPLDEGVSASDFLKRLSAIMQVEYLHEDSLPAAVVAGLKSGSGQLNQNMYHSVDAAAADVRFKNGTYTMRGRLDGNVSCFSTRTPRLNRPPWILNNCSASVRYTVAPEAQFDSVYRQMANVGAVINPAWVAAWKAALDQRTQQSIASSQAATAAQQNAINSQMAQQMAVQQRQHEQFLATMQRGTDISMNNAAQIAAHQHTIASDWVDYALNQQTVADPGSGQLAKVPSGSSYTWRNTAGDQAYQTSDPNANPNGTLAGTWTRQVQVHGDGTTP